MAPLDIGNLLGQTALTIATNKSLALRELILRRHSVCERLFGLTLRRESGVAATVDKVTTALFHSTFTALRILVLTSNSSRVCFARVGDL